MQHLTGFSKVLRRDVRKFVRVTKPKASGKPIYIYGPLAARFANLSQTNLNYLAIRLKSLGALAGGMTSFSNVHDASEHRAIVDKFYITYKVFASTGDPKFPEGMFITHVTEAKFFGLEPAPYEVFIDQNEWVLNKKPKERIDTAYVAINGLCDNPLQAAEDILPEMIEKSWENRKWSSVAPETVDQVGYTMMYNPQCLYSNGKQWKTPDQKRFSKIVAADRLARQISHLQKSGKKTLWTIHGNGAELFNDALQKTAQPKLDTITALFCAPTVPMSELAAKARTKKFSLHDDVLKINSEDWVSRYHQATDGKALKQELMQISGFEEKAEELFRDAEADVMKMTSLAQSVGSGVFKAVTTGVTIGLLDTGVKCAIHGPKRVLNAEMQKIRELQLAAANRSTDHKINPHMMPFKSKTQTIMQAESQDSAGVESFLSLVKTLFRK